MIQFGYPHPCNSFVLILVIFSDKEKNMCVWLHILFFLTGVAHTWKCSLFLQFVFSDIVTIHLIKHIRKYLSCILLFNNFIIYLLFFILLSLIIFIISALLLYVIIYSFLRWDRTIIIGSIIIRVYGIAIVDINRKNIITIIFNTFACFLSIHNT